MSTDEQNGYLALGFFEQIGSDKSAASSLQSQAALNAVKTKADVIKDLM